MWMVRQGLAFWGKNREGWRVSQEVFCVSTQRGGWPLKPLRASLLIPSPVPTKTQGMPFHHSHLKSTHTHTHKKGPLRLKRQKSEALCSGVRRCEIRPEESPTNTVTVTHIKRKKPNSHSIWSELLWILSRIC